MAEKRGKTRALVNRGIGQLTLVEHALCPLHAVGQQAGPVIHQCSFWYRDHQRRRVRSAQVKVTCSGGLFPNDELYLWGLLALTLSQTEPDCEFHATPHYCLRQLGLVDQHQKRGGRQYRQFAEAIERLSMVSYHCDAFYDPIRREHRRVGFRFLSYSLPLDDRSGRAWRIVWDPVFLELVRPAGGILPFDLLVYRQLDPGSRRLFLMLSKLFYRIEQTQPFDVRELCVSVMGFSPTVSTADLKRKLTRCLRKLAELQIVTACARQPEYEKTGVGKYSLRLQRGDYFQNTMKTASLPRQCESPLVEPLRSIGFDDQTIRRLLHKYRNPLLREWIDITLAAIDRGIIRKTPMAYFMDNIKHAAASRRTPPDWWRDLQRKEQIARRSTGGPRNLERAIQVNGSEATKLNEQIAACFVAAGQTRDDSKRNAEKIAREMKSK